MKDERRKPLRFPRPWEVDERTYTSEEVRAAAAWLAEVLRTKGPQPAQQIYLLAEDCDITRTLLALAKKKLGITATDANARVNTTFKLWMWALPKNGLFEDDRVRDHRERDRVRDDDRDPPWDDD
jgi:hypothetical protein